MSKEIYAIDVDDVLFPFVEQFLAYNNRTYGTNFQPDDLVDDCEALMGLSPVEVGGRVHDFHQLDDMHIPPIAGSQLAIKALAERGDELHIITARDPYFEYRTKPWISSNFPGAFRSITHVGHPSLREKVRSKIEICLELGATVLIDDSTHHVAGCPDVNMQGIRFGDYASHRKKAVPLGVTVCKDWYQVLEYFDGRDS